MVSNSTYSFMKGFSMAKLTKLKHKRLAEGEATGHHHSATDPGATLYGNEAGGVQVLDAPNGTDVTHQEHGTVSVPPGEHSIDIVKEFDYEEMEARNVAD